MDQVSPRRRIVVATADVVAESMAGPAIRAWNLAEQLAVEHDVVLISTTRCSVVADGFRTMSGGAAEIDELLVWAEVFVFQGWVMTDFPAIEASDVVVVVDAYDPLHLEQLEQAADRSPKQLQGVITGVLAMLSDQLTRADFVICASEEQRMLWIGHLSALGRISTENYNDDPTLRSLIDVVPFGVDDPPPAGHTGAIRGAIKGIDAEDIVLLWNGGVYNWFDPETLIRAVALLAPRYPQLRLVFMGMQHPNPDQPTQTTALAAVRLAAELGLTGRSVFFNEGWVPYDERHRFLLDADIGVSTHLPGVETDFSFRTRVLDCLWVGLPIITTEGGALANLVAGRRLGAVVRSGDVDAVAAAVESLLEPNVRAAVSERVREVAEEYRWSRATEPLLAFCRDPRPAPDRRIPRTAENRRYDQGVSLQLRGGWRRGLVRVVYLSGRRGIGEVLSTAVRGVVHGIGVTAVGIRRKLMRKGSKA